MSEVLIVKSLHICWPRQSYLSALHFMVLILRFSKLSLISSISSWNDRIPFVLLFSIATSIELFQSKLSRGTIRRLSGTEFQVERIDTEVIFRKVHYHEPALFFGPAVSSLMLRQQHDFIQSPTAFAQTLKVILRFEQFDRL